MQLQASLGTLGNGRGPRRFVEPSLDFDAIVSECVQEREEVSPGCICPSISLHRPSSHCCLLLHCVPPSLPWERPVLLVWSDLQGGRSSGRSWLSRLSSVCPPSVLILCLRALADNPGGQGSTKHQDQRQNLTTAKTCPSCPKLLAADAPSSGRKVGHSGGVTVFARFGQADAILISDPPSRTQGPRTSDSSHSH